MANWIIKRHGSNAANQHMTQTLILGTIVAETSDEAKEKADEKWGRYNNQFFEAIDIAGRTRKGDRQAAADADAMYVDQHIEE